MKVLGGLLMVLGLLISLAVAVSAVFDGQQTAYLTEKGDNPDVQDLGFEPMIVPETQALEPLAAPTILPESGDQLENFLITAPASAIPASPPINWQEQAIGVHPPPTATTEPTWIPDRIVIPQIKMDAPVMSATLKNIEVKGKPFQEWVPPNSFAAGHLTTSPSLGAAGNTVLIGHHNAYGEVFRHLVDLKVGDLIIVYSGEKEFAYEITMRMILKERDQPLEVRLTNAAWIAPSLNERLTLITCWPYASNTHRLIILAIPGDPSAIDNSRLSTRPTSRTISP